ncbi:MAG: VanW family protein [Clostridia bacterium]|nr:VanW family protein [Clostridia bacterium]
MTVLILFFIFKDSILFNSPNNNNSSATRLSLNTNTIIQNIPTEKEISVFSTKIKDNSEGRLTNIRITCSLINDTILAPGDIFSFNDTVGQPTSARGYQEATIIVDGEHETGIGGGNCQVSSTLYNAVYDLPFITIIERNEHGLPVTYVPEGQDAAVSFGSLDLKFRNDSDKNLRIEMTTDDEDIIAKIYQK